MSRTRRTILVGLAGALALFAFGRSRERPLGPTGQWLAAAGLEPRFESVAGRRIRFVRTGSGPPIVFLHGFGSSIYTWRQVLPVLARNHDVVALDLPGFGQSDCPPDLSFEEYPKVVVGLLDRLAIARATLVGNSMGGAVAAVVSAERPERVQRLVLVDAVGFNLDPEQRPWPIRVVGSAPAAAVLDRLPVRRLLVEVSLRQVFFDDSLLTGDRVDEYLEPMLRRGAPQAIRSLLAPRSLPPDTVQKVLPRVAAPTLILWGQQDEWIPVRDAERFAAALRSSRVVVIERCGHMPQEEYPADVARLIEEFRDEARAPAPASSKLLGTPGKSLDSTRRDGTSPEPRGEGPVPETVK
jgi:pimeloyl-ACP methyl ester carboxylesterase